MRLHLVTLDVLAPVKAIVLQLVIVLALLDVKAVRKVLQVLLLMVLL